MAGGEEVSIVTGVAGFIGSHLAERLLREGHFVIGIDCFTDYYAREIKERNIEGLRGGGRFAFIEADLVDMDTTSLFHATARLYRESEAGRDMKIRYVFHMAAQAGVRASWGQSFEVYTQNNILVTQRLLEAARDVPLQKFVYASSSSIYGDALTLPTPEDTTPCPVSPYGVSKLAGEHLCMTYYHNYGTPVTCLRYFTVYGPRQRPDMAFHRFIRTLLEEGEIAVYGDGEQTRDFTYVDDAVDGTVRAAYADVVGEVFNIGGGSQVALNSAINMMEAATGRRAQIRHEDRSRGDVRHTSADTRRAAATLGYSPKTALEEGLKAEAEWIRQNF